MYIRPQNGFELEELHDVLITSPQNNQTILWNSATTLWVNSTLTVGTISGLSADLSGKVASVGATSPVVSSGGTTPTISMPVATATTNGYLASTDWTAFNSKQAGGTYVTSVTGTSPIVSSGGTTPAISIPVATAATSGYLSSTDWSTFNSKQAAGSYVTSITSGITGATQLTNMMQITSAGYSAITSPAANTLYIIVG
jgi:hypothetical protein